MNLFTFVLAFFAILSGVFAVNCGKPICPRGGPFCTFTDAWRQFNYTCTIGHLVNLDNQTVQLYTYNWTCQEIGYEFSIEIGKAFSFTSQLKFAILINFRASDHPPSFTYAGKNYGENATRTLLPDPTCYNSSGQYACETQFECGSEVNQGDFEGGMKWREAVIGTEELVPFANDILG